MYCKAFIISTNVPHWFSRLFSKTVSSVIRSLIFHRNRSLNADFTDNRSTTQYVHYQIIRSLLRIRSKSLYLNLSTRDYGNSKKMGGVKTTCWLINNLRRKSHWVITYLWWFIVTVFIQTQHYKGVFLRQHSHKNWSQWPATELNQYKTAASLFTETVPPSTWFKQYWLSAKQVFKWKLYIVDCNAGLLRVPFRLLRRPRVGKWIMDML